MTTQRTASHGIVEIRKEILVNDLKRVVSDADDLLQEVAHSTAEEFAVARAKVEAKLGEAKVRLDDARIAVTQKARVAADATQEYVKENPWTVVGVAAAAALIAAFFLRRR
jgi:ElaB/YqjD/DUF883 family membrane-anchored ribosome-binding protein